MREKCILGCKVANAVDVSHDALHLALEPIMMPILLLMQANEKLSVIENMRSLSRPLSNCAVSGFGLGTVRCMCSTSQRIDSSGSQHTFNGLTEALTINVMKIKWLLVRLWIDGFNRHIDIWQENNVVACRWLIVESSVKLDQTHDPWSIELQAKNVRS